VGLEKKEVGDENMLFYFVIFLIIGFVIGAVIKDSAKAMTAIIVVSLLWGLVFGPWALAAFVELMIGYALAKHLVKQ
jgi:LytS/YehU family sensor histidine kinase